MFDKHNIHAPMNCKSCIKDPEFYLLPDSSVSEFKNKYLPC